MFGSARQSASRFFHVPLLRYGCAVLIGTAFAVCASHATDKEARPMMFPTIVINREDPSSIDAQTLLDELSATLALFTGDGGQSRFSIHDVALERSRFVLARSASGMPLGCGAFRPLGEHIAEIKRLYARAGADGAGSAILARLEKDAGELGYQALWLGTHTNNRRAIEFYEKHGFHRIEPYGPYVSKTDSCCFEKRLDGQSPDNQRKATMRDA
jgi:GNAT superfamily N-acetyltransferase